MQVGERIAAHRKRRGISQDALAGLVGRSRSWLSQVERGLRRVDKLSTLQELATVLRVSPAELVGHEWEWSPGPSPETRAVDEIRSRLAEYGHLLGDDAPLWPLPQVRAAAVEVHRAYQAASYAATASMLPDVLEVADAYQAFGGAEAREIHRARCLIYAVSAKLLTKMGEGHLAWLAADRASHAAVAADSLAARGLAAYHVACALIQLDRSDDAERVAVAAAESLISGAGPDAPDLVSLTGANWLLAAIVAARRTDRAESIARLAQAESLSELLGRESNQVWTAFGPTNVLIHTASVGALLGDPYAVLQTATRIDTNHLPGGLNGRRAQIHLDLAWAQTQARSDLEAVLHLQHAERVAPEIIRYHPVVRTMTRELLKRSRRPSPALSALAQRAGVLT